MARGPKPLSVLREYQIPVQLAVPEPNTWHEIIEKLEECPAGFTLEGSRVAIQEYGSPNPSLVEQLQCRSAQVVPVPVYRWGVPRDTRPLLEALGAIIAKKARVLLFTNAIQIENVLKIATENGLKETLLAALQQCVVCSVGPICSEALRANNIAVDLEPKHPKMGPLVLEAVRGAIGILKNKTAT